MTPFQIYFFRMVIIFIVLCQISTFYTLHAQQINYILYDYTNTRHIEEKLKYCNFGQLYAERNDSSKIKMYFSNYDYNTGIGLIYNKEGLHFINMKPDSVIYSIINESTIENYFNGNHITSVLPQYYLGGQHPELSDSINWKKPPQINWVNKQCKITYFYKGGEASDNKTTYIYAENGSLKSILFEYTYQGLNIKDEFSLTNIVFNEKMNKLELTPWLLTRKKDTEKPTLNKQNDIPKTSPNSATLLDNLKNLSTNTSLSSALEDEELILLDFWYISCPPCIKSMPTVNEIKELYKNSGLKIVSINSIDKVTLINKFAGKNNMNTDEIFISDRSILDLMNITSFPSFILVNNQGKELGRIQGINDLKENLVRLIEQHLH